MRLKHFFINLCITFFKFSFFSFLSGKCLVSGEIMYLHSCPFFQFLQVKDYAWHQKFYLNKLFNKACIMTWICVVFSCYLCVIYLILFDIYMVFILHYFLWKNSNLKFVYFTFKLRMVAPTYSFICRCKCLIVVVIFILLVIVRMMTLILLLVALPFLMLSWSCH